MFILFVLLNVAFCGDHSGIWCYDTSRTGQCRDTFSDECLSWCDIKEECYEMDRLYGDGSHTYLRGCWLPGSDDAMKQTGCVTVNAEDNTSDAESQPRLESFCVSTCAETKCNNNLQFADVFSGAACETAVVALILTFLL